MRAFWCFLVFAGSAVAAEESCTMHAERTCLEPGSNWKQGPCNSVYGGFRGNEDNLQDLMRSHLDDSFKFLVMASKFNTDQVNRLGMHGLLQGHSDEMWAKGKDLLGYVLKRGGKLKQPLEVNEFDVSRVEGEVDALASSLDMYKRHAETAIEAYKQASKDGDSYDPGVKHYLEESLIEPKTETIRELAGKLNILSKMAKVDNTRNMALHLFDKSM